jgi:hypothetical protein
MPPPLTSGRGVAFAPFQDPPRPSAGQVLWEDAVGEGFDASGQPTRFHAEAGNITYTYSRESGSQLVDSGSDGMMAWGRWVGPVRQSPQELVYNFGADGGVHYVVGTRSASNATTGSATYSLIGATAPTWSDGTGPPGRLSGSISVDFADPVGRIGINFVVEMSGGRRYTIAGYAYPDGLNFRGPRSFDDNNGIRLTETTGCTLGCWLRIEGFFADPNGERIGVAYIIFDPKTPPQVGGLVSSIQGTAAFGRTATR